MHHFPHTMVVWCHRLDARWNGRFARSSDALRGCSAVPSWELLQPETLDAVVCPDAEDMMGLPWLRAECVRRGIPCPPILVHTAARAQAAVLLRSRVAWSQAETRRMLPSDGPGGAEPAAMGKDNVWNDAWSRMLDSEHDEGGGGVVEDGSGWELELDRRIAPPAASTEGIQWVPAPSWSQTQALLSHAVPTAFGQPWRLESDSRAWLAAGVDIPGGLMQCFIRSDFASRAPPGPTIVHTSLPRADAPRSEAPQPVVPALWMVALPAGGTGGASAFLGSDGKHQFLILGRWLGRSRRLRPGRVGSGHGVSMLDSDAVRGCRDWFVAGEALQLQHVSPSAPSAPGATEGENVEPLTGQPDDAIRSRAVIRPSGMVAENESPDAGSTWVRQFERFIDAIGAFVVLFQRSLPILHPLLWFDSWTCRQGDGAVAVHLGAAGPDGQRRGVAPEARRAGLFAERRGPCDGAPIQAARARPAEASAARCVR